MKDTHVFAEHRFSLGIDEETGKPCLPFPVSNRLCEHEVYNWIDPHMYDRAPGNLPELLAFANQCKLLQKDELLALPPGTDRGWPKRWD